MTQRIFLHCLLLRKHDSALNDFEPFWRFWGKITDIVIKLQSCASVFNCLDSMRPLDLAMPWCPWERRFANQARHVLGELASQQWHVFVCLSCSLTVSVQTQKWQFAAVLCWLSTLTSACESAWKSKSLASFSFSFNFPQIWRSF